MASPRSIVGTVIERNTNLKPSTPFVPTSISENSQRTGFPSAQHRSKSAFTRAREVQKSRVQDSERARETPAVQPTTGKPRSSADDAASEKAAGSSQIGRAAHPTDWRDQISLENERRVEGMTEEEREKERAEIIEKFGLNITDILRKAKEARERNNKRQHEAFEGSDLTHIRSSSDQKGDARRHRGILVSTSPPGSRSSTPGRSNRKIRFADVTADDVHVYESQPSSPRRVLGLLTPPTSEDKGIPILELAPKETDAVQIEDVGNRPDLQATLSDDTAGPPSTPSSPPDPEEGTPEDIRRRFFPNVSPHDPSLEWIERESAASAPAGSPEVRFDLSGRAITPEDRARLPTYLGLHHHSGDDAGYTLDDLFLLSRSTVPAQRATMVGVLAKVVRQLAKGDIPELAGREAEIRKRALGAGVEAMGQRGSLGIQAIELAWECVVGWDVGLTEVEGVEFADQASQNSTTSTNDGSSDTATSADPTAGLPMGYLLPLIASHFNSAALPPEALSQLLSILHRLAQLPNHIAETIMRTPDMVLSIMRAFILTPIPPTETSRHPDPFAIRVLRTLALASRENAQALMDPADALLRFVTTLPTDSAFSLPLATDLLASTLELYATLASYGLYAHVAATAAAPFAALGRYVVSRECTSRSLMAAWLGLLEVWMICATDPHRTTPPHDILWSQVVGAGWGEDMLILRQKLTGAAEDRGVWSALWRAGAAWLEGCRVNSVKNGQEERRAVTDSVSDGFENGVEKEVIVSAISDLRDAISLEASSPQESGRTTGFGRYRRFASSAECLQSYSRFCLACTPSAADSSELPMSITTEFSQLSELVDEVSTHLLRFADDKNVIRCLSHRPVTSFIWHHLKVLRATSRGTEETWLSLAVATLETLVPGDEEYGQWILVEIMKVVSATSDAGADAFPPATLATNISAVLMPFLAHSLRPKGEVYVAPWTASSTSIQRATTQRLPANSFTSSGDFGVPFRKDWPVYAIDHLLRSGSSSVFQTLPPAWDASETEIVRASLLLAKRIQDTLVRSDRTPFAMSRGQIVFSCMKVFMLENGQQHDDSSEEVFRDNLVGQLMEDLLRPYTYSAASPAVPSGLENLEDVAKSFLKPLTPFYQFYTDFVGLYDAISFSHSLFTRLLLPPTSMRYAPDYRKYLWGDYGHILRTLRTPIDQVIIDDLGAYLWPVEQDAEMLGWYMRALVKWPLEGFVRFVAIHHVASNIWPDLRGGDDRQGRGKMLLRAVVDQGNFGVVKDVVRYKQTSEGELKLPPLCFEEDGEWRKARIDCLVEWRDLSLKDKLEKILLNTE